MITISVILTLMVAALSYAIVVVLWDRVRHHDHLPR